MKADELGVHELTLRAYRREDWGPNGAVCLVGYARDGKFVAQPLTLDEYRERPYVLPTVAFLDPTKAQVLMDSLWNCGLRPTEGAGSAGAMAAVQRHLADMRTLVAAKMGLKEWGKP